jgi:hypothetical protein
MQSTRYSCNILMKLEFSRQISEKYSNIKFHENPSSGSRVVQCGRTDGRAENMMKLIVAFRNFVNAPKNLGTFYTLKIVVLYTVEVMKLVFACFFPFDKSIIFPDHKTIYIAPKLLLHF